MRLTHRVPVGRASGKWMRIDAVGLESADNEIRRRGDLSKCAAGNLDRDARKRSCRGNGNECSLERDAPTDHDKNMPIARV